MRIECKVLTQFNYKCQLPVKSDTGYCEHHKDLKCCICGDNATHLKYKQGNLFDTDAYCEHCKNLSTGRPLKPM